MESAKTQKQLETDIELYGKQLEEAKKRLAWEQSTIKTVLFTGGKSAAYVAALAVASSLGGPIGIGVAIGSTLLYARSTLSNFFDDNSNKKVNELKSNVSLLEGLLSKNKEALEKLSTPPSDSPSLITQILQNSPVAVLDIQQSKELEVTKVSIDANVNMEYEPLIQPIPTYQQPVTSSVTPKLTDEDDEFVIVNGNSM